jgi:hypothetical protein
MTTQYIKLINLININTQEAVCPQYNNRKVNYSKFVIKVGEPLKIVDTDNVFFSHEVVTGIQDGYYGFTVFTTNKTWFFDYCDENWNSIG